MSENHDGARVIRVKVKPYPFEGVIELNGVKKNLEIVYLSAKGLVAKLHGQFVNVGEHYQAVFELPTLGEFINTPVRVMKTYDKALDSKTQHVERMAEFHFEKLTDEYKARIVSFMAKIGQAK